MRSTLATDRELATQLRLALARSARRLRQEAGGDLSPSLMSALATVERHGPVTPSELAARERVQRPTITRIAVRLEEAKLIERTGSESDRRSTVLAVTPAGRALLKEVRTRKDAFLSERLDALEPQERATLAEAAALLERMLG
jgi:DNA-binding MarR family transcriptional regulator